MNLSDTVRKISKELKISLAEIARRTGQSPQNLSKKMNKGTLSFEEFEQILKVLNVNMDVSFSLPGRQALHEDDNEQLLRQMQILEMQLDVERMKNKYFSEISYRYRTALSTVSGGLELAKKHIGDPAKAAGCIDKTLPAVAELTKLIEDSPFNREAGIAADPKEDAEISDLDITGKRILLVDDNDINREIMRELLEDRGIFAGEAVNGRDAIHKLEDHQSGYYDLILMDLLMPVMDGYEATRVIRRMRDKAKAEIPVVAMKASVS